MEPFRKGREGNLRRRKKLLSSPRKLKEGKGMEARRADPVRLCEKGQSPDLLCSQADYRKQGCPERRKQKGWQEKVTSSRERRTQ